MYRGRATYSGGRSPIPRACATVWDGWSRSARRQFSRWKTCAGIGRRNPASRRVSATSCRGKEACGWLENFREFSLEGWTFALSTSSSAIRGFQPLWWSCPKRSSNIPFERSTSSLSRCCHKEVRIWSLVSRITITRKQAKYIKTGVHKFRALVGLS